MNRKMFNVYFLWKTKLKRKWNRLGRLKINVKNKHILYTHALILLYVCVCMYVCYMRNHSICERWCLCMSADDVATAVSTGAAHCAHIYGLCVMCDESSFAACGLNKCYGYFICRWLFVATHYPRVLRVPCAVLCGEFFLLNSVGHPKTHPHTTIWVVISYVAREMHKFWTV